MHVPLIALAIFLLFAPAAWAESSAEWCRFKSDKDRQSLVGKTGPFSRAMHALGEGDTEGAMAAFDLLLTDGSVSEIEPAFAASYYLEGWCGFPIDPARAAAFYRAGVRLNDSGAMLNLAVMTWHGVGVPVDRAAAIHLFRQGLIGYGMVNGDEDIPNLEGLVEAAPVPPELLREFAWVKRLAETPGTGRQAADEALATSPAFVGAACRYMAFSFDKHKDGETAYRLGMMHLGGQGIVTSRFYAYHYLLNAAFDSHPAAHAEIGRRLIAKDIPMKYEWDALTWLMRARRLGIDTSAEIELAKQGLPASAVRQAEISSAYLPNLSTQKSDGRGECKGVP
ncbi:MAG: sel1 repeat family protein [Alphaproteobacteria bacterium]|nr:sel1 repeat family protein [Alphaproteobacteria bacterium]